MFSINTLQNLTTQIDTPIIAIIFHIKPLKTGNILILLIETKSLGLTVKIISLFIPLIVMKITSVYNHFVSIIKIQ